MNLLEAALSYAARGWPVLPLAYPVLVGAAPRCSCGRAACRRVGKHPAGRLVPRGVHEATTDEETVRSWWRRSPRANIGLALGAGAGMFALDIDPRAEGDRTLIELVRTCGPLTETLHALTGSGGDHFFFAWPGRSVRCGASRIGAGIDVIGEGGYVVAAPSLHACGERYAWFAREHKSEVREAPRWLLYQVAPPPIPRQDRGGARREVDRRARASSYLAAMPEAVAGSGGDRQTWRAALALVVGFALDPRDALEMLEREYNPRCQPPWSHRELEHKVATASRSKLPRGYLLGGRAA